MKKTVYIKSNKKTVTITDAANSRPSSSVATFLARGGQASIYLMQGCVLKIYHDVDKSIPEKKIQELNAINNNDSIIIPKQLVYNKGNKIIGYTMDYINNTVPLCQYFPKAFKKRHNIGQNDINTIVKKCQSTLEFIHDKNILVVDLNELNILVNNPPNVDGKSYYIDVDSYQTPSFPASAIMESIRDRQVKGLQWNEGSDWFSWACITFNLYTKYHPYMGKHPDYTVEKNGKSKLDQRMDNHISIFDKNVSYPKSVVNDFNTIPKRHLDWFKSVFINGDRSPPPLADSSAPIIVDGKTKIIIGNSNFKIVQVLELKQTIKDVFSLFGSNYFATDDYIYREGGILLNNSCKHKIVGFSDKMQPIIMVDNTLYNKSGEEIYKTTSKNSFARNGRVYNLHNNALNFIDTRTYNNKIFVNELKLDNTSYSAKMFPGLVIQNLLGKIYLTIPYDDKKSCSLKINELDNYRILDAKSEDKFAIVIGEKGGKYSRFVIIADYNNKTYIIKETKNVTFDIINFTIIRGMCILMTDINSIAIFKDLQTIKIIDNTPFDSSCILFNDGGTVYFCDEKIVYSLTMK